MTPRPSCVSAGKDYLALRLRASRKRSEQLQTLAWTALQRLSKQLERTQNRPQVMGRQEAQQAEQAVMQVLRRQFMRGYLTRNPCCDFSRLMKGPLKIEEPDEKTKEGKQMSWANVVRVGRLS